MNKFSTSCLCCKNKPFIPSDSLKKIENFFSENKISLSLVKDELTHWRIRAKLAVREYEKNLTLGLFYERSHKIAPVTSCIAHHKLITKIVLVIEKEAKLHGISPFNDDSLKGDLRYVQISVNDAENKAQVALVVNHKKLTTKLQKFAKALMKYQFIESIWVNYNINKNNIIFSNQWEHLFGNDYLILNILGKNFAFHPAAFMQAHKQVFEKMINYIKNNINENENILELYAGIGAIGLSLISKVKSLTLIEHNPFSKLSFESTLALSFLKYKNKISYICNDATYLDDFTSFDTIVLDPPRKGLSTEMLKKLVDLENKKIIYVSCNFISFERDVNELKKNNWQLVDAKCFLMFPSSEHIEIVGVLKKNK